MIWVGVALAGAAGAACRYVVDYLVTARSGSDYPWGTLVVNVSGALLLGIVAGVVAHHGAPDGAHTVIGGGFCGAYTTFSTLVHETWRLVEERAWGHAVANLASLLVGVAAAAVGWALTLL